MRSSLTFRTAFERFHLPVLLHDRAAINTIYNYRYGLARWEKYGESDLPPDELRQSHLLTFRMRLIDAGLSPSSFDSSWRVMRAVLGTLVAEEIVASIPRTPRLKSHDAVKRTRPTPEEFDRLVEACDVADWPLTSCRRRLRVPPSTIWRAVYRVAYLTALRRGDLAALRWSHLTADGLRIVAQKTRRYGKEIYVPDVRGALLAAVAPMRAAGLPRVLPVNVGKGVEVARVTDAIAMAAGVAPDKAKFHAIRRASLDAWTKASVYAPGLIAGHGLRAFLPRVTRERYVADTAESAKVESLLREAAERFPLPRSIQPIGKES